MRSLCHDLERVLPNAAHMSRGKLGLIEVFDRALDEETAKLILVERWKGGPGRIHFYQITPEAPRRLLSLILGGVKTQIDFGRRRRLSSRLVVTVADDAPSNVVKLAQFVASFLMIPLAPSTPKESTTPTLRISPSPDHEARIQVHAPPSGREVGPRLSVTKAVWETAR